MAKKHYVIYDIKTKLFVSYLKGMFSSDCWTSISRCANRYTLGGAMLEREWLSKVCKIKITDLIICEMKVFGLDCEEGYES